jgi:hypothetical protein
MSELRTKVSDSFKADFLGHAKEIGLNQAEAVSEALEQYLKGNSQPSSSPTSPCSFLQDETPREFFGSVKNKGDDHKRTELIEALDGHGVKAEGETIRLTSAQLLALASKISGKPETEILSDGLSYIAQKMITQELAGNSNQGTLGSADRRIIETINELRQMISQGEYKPRKNKEGKALLGDSVIAGKAMTSTVTVKNFLKRKPEYLELIDVSDL